MQSLAPDSGSSFREREIGERRQPGGGAACLSPPPSPRPRPPPPSARAAPPPAPFGSPPPPRKGKKGEKSRAVERTGAAGAGGGGRRGVGGGSGRGSGAGEPTAQASAPRPNPAPGPRAPHSLQPGHPDPPGARGAPPSRGWGGACERPRVRSWERLGGARSGSGAAATVASGRARCSAAGDAVRSGGFASRWIKSLPAGPLLLREGKKGFGGGGGAARGGVLRWKVVGGGVAFRTSQLRRLGLRSTQVWAWSLGV